MIPCDNTTLQSELKAYLDGQLPFLMRLRVRRHLGNCAACREELSAMEQISNKLRADGPKPLQSSLRDRILNAVSNTSYNTGAASATDMPITSPARRRRKPLLIWAGAATALVAWFTLYPLLHRDILGDVMMRRVESNGSSVGAAAPTYTQDYDEVMASSKHAAVAKRMPERALAGIPPTATSSPAPDHGHGGEERAGKAETARHAFQPMDSVDAGRPTIMNGRATRMSPLKQNSSVAFEAQMRQPLNYKRIQSQEFARSAAMSGALAVPQEEAKVERQVNRVAHLTVQVDNPEAKSETAAQYAQTAGGFVASNELSTGDDNTKTASLTLKVPVAQFEAVLSQIAHMGEVKAKNVTGEDLTEKISDQEQGEHILRQDIGATQDELTHRLSKSTREERMDSLRELRTRIAQTRARLQLLRKLGALSTITLELNEKPRPAPTPKVGGFMSDMNDALHGAMQSMMQAARLPILTFIWILAYSPLWILLIVGYRYAVRR